MKRVYRLPPCPAYDIEAMEQWLSDMALNGLALAEDGFFWGLAVFERATPQKIRYRLATAVKHASFWNEYDHPDEDTVALSEAMGWEYVCRRGDFYIYRSADANARELNTDSEVQAMALKELNKRFLLRVIDLVVWFAVWFVLFPILEHDFHLLRITLELGTPCTLLAILFLLWRFFHSVHSLIHLRALRKRLFGQGSLIHEKDWTVGAKRYRVYYVLQPVLIAAFLIVLFATAYVRSAPAIPLEDYDQPLPFATISDLVDGAYAPLPFPIDDEVRLWHDYLAPINVVYAEHGQVTDSYGDILECALYVDYHETIHPMLAQLLAMEYHLNDRSGSYELLDAPQIDADYVVVYLDEIHFPCAIIRKGNCVMHAQFIQFSGSTLSNEEWVSILAESFG